MSSRKICPRPLEEQLERVKKVGVSRIILREKDLSEGEYFQLAQKILKRCGELKMECILHTFAGAAQALGVKKIHLPFSLVTQEITQQFCLVGCSVHSVEEACRARDLGVSYLTAGHIFATDCKKGLPPRGLDFLKSVCESVDIPVYGIGGISEENISDLLAVGASGGCIMSGLMSI